MKFAGARGATGVLTAKWLRLEVTSQRRAGRKVNRDLKFTKGSVVKAARPPSRIACQELVKALSSLLAGVGCVREAADAGARKLKYFPLNVSRGVVAALIYRGRFPFFPASRFCLPFCCLRRGTHACARCSGDFSARGAVAKSC